MMRIMDEAILAEQAAYYNARASEYEEWFYRRGRYDRGDEVNSAWNHETALLREALRSCAPLGRVVELACGSGIWTRDLAELADTVTAVDASVEMLALNQGRMRKRNVRYVRADLFEWEPEETFDFVFCSFWLSHVPPESFDAFLDHLRRMLRPGGRLLAMDSLREETSTARDHVLSAEGSPVQVRRLNDGREFRVVKIYYSPDGLEESLRRYGFEARVSTTGRFFWYANAVRTA